MFGLFILGVLVVGGAAFWYLRSLPGPVRIEAMVPRAQAPRAPGRPTPSASPKSLLVHVAGLVRNPGVYELRQGDRVIDAIRLAGGVREGADLISINLAAVLSDAQQIVIGKAGAKSRGGESRVGSTGSAGSDPDPGKVNLNTATLDELMSLPGIGEVLGQRIVDYRREHGPFETVEDLVNVSGIGDQRLADLRSEVTV